MAKNNKKNVNNVENNEKKFEVWDAVVATAQSGKAYGLNADVSEERQAAHVSVCKQLVSLLVHQPTASSSSLKATCPSDITGSPPIVGFLQAGDHGSRPVRPYQTSRPESPH